MPLDPLYVAVGRYIHYQRVHYGQRPDLFSGLLRSSDALFRRFCPVLCPQRETLTLFIPLKPIIPAQWPFARCRARGYNGQARLGSPVDLPAVRRLHGRVRRLKDLAGLVPRSGGEANVV